MHSKRSAAASKVSIAIAAVALGVCGAHAQDASPWDGDAHARARLIAGASTRSDASVVVRAGLEIKLDPGWKTYWRYPGDSGVPPVFDFSASTNIKTITALWPAPQRFTDGGGGYSIGYVGDVVLPLRIVPQDPTKPVSLQAKLAFAACHDICVPAQADIGLMLSGSAGGLDATLTAAEALVPKRVPLGAAGTVSVLSVHREAGGPRERVVVVVAAPAGAPLELFVEGPTSEWALPLPEPAAPPPGTPAGQRLYAFDLEGMPPGAPAKGAMLTLTAVAPDGAIEVETRLD